MSDRDFVERSRAGERAAFDALIAIWLRRVQAVVAAELGRRAEADDAVQDTFVIAWDRLGQLADPDAFGPWLLAIARNSARGWGRRLARNPAPLEAAGVPVAASAPESVDLGLLKAIARLDANSREILHLKYQAGLSYADLCATLKLKPDAVEKRLWRARKALLDQLHRQEPPA